MSDDENDDDASKLLFVSPQARDAHLCKKPIRSTVAGEPMEFLCLRFRGHEGTCMAAAVLRGGVR